MSTPKHTARSVTAGDGVASRGYPRTVLIVAESLEQSALAMLIRRVDADAQIHEFRTLAAARGWIDAGGRLDLAVVQAEVLGSFGAASVRMWKQSAPDAMLALYAAPDGELGRRALAAGFDAVLARTAEPPEFAAALAFVLAGNRYIAPAYIGPAERDHSCAFTGACGWALPLLDDLPIGLFVVQGERVTYSNRYMLEHFGYTAEQLRSMTFWDAVVDPHKTQIRDAALGWLRGEAVAPNFIAPVHTSDGAVRWVESFHRLLTIGGGPAVIVACIDVTARMATVDRAMAATMTPAELASGIYLPGGRRAPALGDAGAAPALDGEAVAGLTERQRQVLALLAIGSSNKDIGAKLGISEATVKLHVHHIMRALGVSNRTAAALMARRLGT